MGVYSKYKYVNPVMGGLSGLTLPTGGTGDRGSPPVGTIRYNTDLGLVEQFNALGWQSVDAPPTVSSFSGVINENTNTTLTITGSNFKSGAAAYITGPAVSSIDRALATTWVTASTITVATNAQGVNYIGGAAFGLKVVNPSGLGGSLDPAGFIDRDPVWTSPSTNGSPTLIFNSARASATVAHNATDSDGNAITYSLASGSLPAGASLNTSTGAVTGFSAVGADATSTYTLRATSTSSTGGLVSTQDRVFQITVKAPVTQTYTSVTTTSWTAPFTGTVQVLVVAGGGAGGGGTAGGGGAGGLVVHPAFPVTSGTPYTVTVGGGAPMPTGQNTGVGSNGGNSVFGGITAVGGGGGSGYPPGASGQNGGSGGGAGQYPGWGGPFGHGSATANTTAGGTGYGNPGGQYSGSPGSHGGGGGGGAGGGGQGGPQGNGGVGLAFPQFDGTTRAGGGQGATNNDQSKGNAAGGGGRGGPGSQQNSGSSPYPGSGRGGESGAANTGGGGGGGWDYGGGGSGQGGSGIVIVKY